ncbi:vitamin B12 ABC transporter permease [Citrobacter koseri]|uniref:Vitamin B12 ABC transporter permease n=1 Tax=Citrobacter koseri TaxID=545 RepID=A0A2X2UZV2_CITKO|nr:vitamin B12 ABC transporter permease [Citrobacter koseri]
MSVVLAACRAARMAGGEILTPCPAENGVVCAGVCHAGRRTAGFGRVAGSLPVPASAIGRALFSPQALTEQQQYVVWDVRLPRLLMALLCGAMLGLAGAAMQSITRNGLADPGLIGVKRGE